MDDQDKIIQFLRLTGPTLPAKVAKQLNTQILLASAHLSDLAAQGKVKISYLKIGGSPLYYLPGQEGQLDKFASGNLNPKDVQVLQVLKEQKVLREADADLLTKVALRSLRDFAVPLQVTVEGKRELFWKWRLLSAEETNQALTQAFAPPLLPGQAVPEPTPRLEPTVATISESSAALVSSGTAPTSALQPDGAEKPLAGPFAKTDIRQPLSVQKLSKTPPQRSRKPVEEDFFPELERLFRKLSITIDQKETVRKEKELNLVLKVPSAVGMMSYFCKAKNKAKCDEKDLSAAYLEAQVKKMPLLFLHTGEMSKKAFEMLKSGVMENVMVRKVE